jgi:hypothetical protein
MAWHAIGRGIGRASHLGVKVARAAVIFSSCDSATEESGRTNPTPRLRVGLQSTLGLSPDSSVAIDCQNVSPEPGAFDDTTGPARRVCARPFCERCPTSDRLWPKVRETITKPGFRSVTFGLFFIGEIEGLMIRPLLPLSRERKGLGEGASRQFVSLACRSPRRSTTSSRPRFRRRGGARSIGARSSNGGARLLSSSRGSAGTRVGRRCASPSERFRPAKRRRDQKQKHRSNRHRRERARRRG